MLFFLTFFFPLQPARAEGGVVTLPNPLQKIAPLNVSAEKGVAVLVGRILQAALGLLGVAGLVILVAGGMVWLTSGGVDDKIKKGKDIIAGAILGLVVIFAGYFILDAVIRALSG